MDIGATDGVECDSLGGTGPGAGRVWIECVSDNAFIGDEEQRYVMTWMANSSTLLCSVPTEHVPFHTPRLLPHALQHLGACTVDGEV